MKIFLAAQSSYTKLNWDNCKYVLESFYYIKPEQIPQIKKTKMFFLDSGAFTFFTKAQDTDWNKYIKKYADFINKNDIKYFFELDIDSVAGYEKVIEYRKMLEALTGKKCIPVWHKSRGMGEFLKMCEEYDYVAIGGIVSKEIKEKEYKYFSILINEAHKRKCKIHALGFTKMTQLKKYRFDSVDSTAWKGARFGSISVFTGNCIKYKSLGRIKDHMKATEFCLQEWIKFQNYAERNL